MAEAEVDMTATDMLIQDEMQRIERWRVEELERAGYSRNQALELGTRHDVDLHLAADLLRKGCPADLAIQILL
jgi:hypothetical protein